MSTGLIDIMKSASMAAVDNAQMCDLRFGTVTSVSPLKVQVTSNFIIPSTLLIVPEHLTDHAVNVSIDWGTDDDSYAISGTKTMIVNNGLRIGERVALLRKQGGQSYFILDRI